MYLVMGFFSVKRAEVPKRVHVPELRYESPVEIDLADEQADWSSSEFRGYRRLSWGTVMEGMDPYRDIGHVRAYPPFGAIGFFPFSAPWRLRGVGSTIYFSTGFAFALLMAWAWSWGAGEKGGARFGRFALLFIMLAPLSMNCLARCSSQMLVLGPVAVGTAWLTQGRRPVWAGALLGLAASFKVLPGIFGVYLIATRQWRALAGMAIGGVFCTVFLSMLVFGPQRAWDLHKSWFEVVIVPYSSGDINTIVGNSFREGNQAMTATAHRYLRDLPVMVGSKYTERERREMRINVANLDEDTIGRGLRVVKIGILAGFILLWALATPGSVAGKAVLAASPALGMLLLSEISTVTHHVMVILPPAALMVAGLDSGQRAARRWLWLIPGWFVTMVLVGVAKVFGPLFFFTALCTAATVHVALADRQRAGDSAVDSAETTG